MVVVDERQQAIYVYVDDGICFSSGAEQMTCDSNQLMTRYTDDLEAIGFVGNERVLAQDVWWVMNRSPHLLC